MVPGLSPLAPNNPHIFEERCAAADLLESLKLVRMFISPNLAFLVQVMHDNCSAGVKGRHTPLTRVLRMGCKLQING